MKAYLEAARAKYGLPVWVNEFACSSMGDAAVPVEEVEQFMRESMGWLDGHDWIERYAYFGNGVSKTVGNWVGQGSDFCQLEDGAEQTDGRVLSRVGRIYTAS